MKYILDVFPYSKDESTEECLEALKTYLNVDQTIEMESRIDYLIENGFAKNLIEKLMENQTL